MVAHLASKHKAAIYKALLQKCGGDRGTTPEPRFFRPFKLSTVEQLDPVRPQLTNRGNMPVQSLPGYPKFLA